MRYDARPDGAAARAAGPPRIVWIAAQGPDARLRDALHDHGYALVHVEPGPEAMRHCAALHPDALVLALDEADDAPAAAAALRAVHPGALLVLVPRLAPVDEVLLLDAGADAVAPRGGPSLVLLARLRRLLRRAPAGGIEVVAPACSVRLDGRALGLGHTAVALMDELARRNGSPAPRASLARHLASGARGRSRTLDMAISRLRQALRAQGVDEVAIESVRGFGYRLVVRGAA